MKIRTIAIALAVALPALVATAQAAIVAKKGVDTNRLVRKHLKNERKYTVVVPKGKDVRSIHLIANGGRLMSIPVDGIQFGTPVAANGPNSECGGNMEISTNLLTFDRCCRYAGNECTATTTCRHYVSICKNLNDNETFIATGPAFGCLECPAAGVPDSLMTEPPNGW